ncbi:N [Resistencia virus]|uniref:Nucleoprotein n=4 Tax=Orthobunyavirus bellavistaense TaxID=3052373 RepID=A0A191T888_9VIRU|nr:nucleocapsid protein [Bellavista virus]ANI69986.1 nucleocapsid protein [Bellavista virus]QLA47038.1 N [Resistencia virus] [Resistencia virus]QLA47093.1 N [Barranqueras virus] [Barranqueras virus]QLA47103.1 N [Antequera virus] [Antequera virus]
MSVAIFEFEDVRREGNNSNFIPGDAYKLFINNHGEFLDFPTIANFYANAKGAKLKLRSSDARKALLRFRNWRVEVVNNHNPRLGKAEVLPTELTLHRISGFLAKYLLTIANGNDPARVLDMQAAIPNPLALEKGIGWSAGAEIHLAFLPGTEMFLEEFKFYPLALGIYRVQQGDMDPEFLKKIMRQQYGAMKPSEWLVAKKETIKTAVSIVSTLKWGSKGFSSAAQDLLKEFGIKV